VHGLFVAESEEVAEADETKAVAEEFRRRCESAGFKAKLTAEAGDVVDVISERARWVDLVVIDSVPERLGKNVSGSELHLVIPQCSRPILVVSGPARELRRALLIYDGRPESGTALFVAEHLALRHGIELKIFSTTEGDWSTNQKTVRKAREHLEKSGIQAEVLEVGGRVVPAILQVARQSECDWIITPGYAGSAAAGDTLLDRMMSVSERPLLICP
jgi:nucleotide-binding universal stress UspA family protein